MDIRRLMDEMHEAITDEEQDRVVEKIKSLFDSLSNDEKKKVSAEFSKMFDEFLERGRQELKDIETEVKLLKIEKYVSLAQIAREYFGKSRAWLYQRVKGYRVNGKAAKFTPEEREKLVLALKDISQKIHDVALSI